MLKVGFYIIMVMFCTQISLGQNEKANDLSEKITKNKELFKTDPQQAFQEIDRLLDEAIKLKDANAELKILSTRYEYDYLLKIDFEQMISSANILKDRAKAYKSLLYEAKAHKYLAQTYSFNELFDKSLEELWLGMGVLERANAEDAFIIMEKANIHTAFANVYNLKKEYFSGIQSLLNSVKEHEKLKDPELKRGAKFMDYTNLGGAYLKVNLDSAKYYANRSIDLSIPRESNHNLMFINYLVIGNVHLQKKEYNLALEFYKKAESIKENKHFVNLKELYEKFITTHETLGNSELKEVYENKLKDLSLTVTQNQNKSLRKIIQEDRKGQRESTSKNNLWIWIALLGAFLSGIFVFLFLNQRNKKMNNEVQLTPETYNNLIALLKENDQSFLLTFETEFPRFVQTLTKEYPELSNAEIELLAMIKLGLTSKEIAQYKFIQHKTVQNKRYMIRKKLNLSSDTDLNKWIEGLG